MVLGIQKVSVEDKLTICLYYDQQLYRIQTKHYSMDSHVLYPCIFSHKVFQSVLLNKLRSDLQNGTFYIPNIRSFHTFQSILQQTPCPCLSYSSPMKYSVYYFIGSYTWWSKASPVQVKFHFTMYVNQILSYNKEHSSLCTQWISIHCCIRFLYLVHYKLTYFFVFSLAYRKFQYAKIIGISIVTTWINYYLNLFSTNNAKIRVLKEEIRLSQVLELM